MDGRTGQEASDGNNLFVSDLQGYRSPNSRNVIIGAFCRMLRGTFSDAATVAFLEDLE